MLEFMKITDFPRGTLYDILKDAYSYDSRNKDIWEDNWKESDAFFSILCTKGGANGKKVYFLIKDTTREAVIRSGRHQGRTTITVSSVNRTEELFIDCQ